MELVLWIAVGGALGWVAMTYLGVNRERGALVSMIIGAIGGVIGGKLVAPMLEAGAAVPGEFSMAALLIVLASSAACLTLGNMVHNRFGV
jgi:uncharacterized membrane protein YeaQ/YmgE (transglycosylase-associated protein family)